MRTLVGAAVVAVLLVACAPHRPATVADAESVLAARGAAAQYANVPRTIAEALPSTRYVSAVGGMEGRASDLVVTGRFTAWTPDKAMVWPAGTGGDNGRQVAWDSKRAQTRTLDLTFDVDSVVAAAAGVTADHQVQVRFGLDGRTSPGSFANGLISGGRMVLFLQPPSDPTAKGVWAVPFDGLLLGTVDDADVVTMGVLDAEPDFADLAASTHGITLADLEAAGHVSRTVTFGG